jgi:hypothetical protein
MEIINKSKEVNLLQLMKKQKANVVSSNWTTIILKVNACIVRRYFSTCATACVQHNCASGSGERSKAIFENL